MHRLKRCRAGEIAVTDMSTEAIGKRERSLERAEDDEVADIHRLILADRASKMPPQFVVGPLGLRKFLFKGFGHGLDVAGPERGAQLVNAGFPGLLLTCQQKAAAGSRHRRERAGAR